MIDMSTSVLKISVRGGCRCFVAICVKLESPAVVGPFLEVQTDVRYPTLYRFPTK